MSTANSLVFSVTSNNINFQKKTPREDPSSSSKRILSFLYEGFLDLKKTLDEDTIQELKRNIPLENDKEKMSKVDPIMVLQYVREIAKHLVEVHEKQENEEEEATPNHYELEIQKLEAEVRQHIRMEQQMKILVEKNQEKLEEYEKIGTGNEKNQKILKDLSQESDSLKSEVEKKDKEIEKLQHEIKQKANILSLQDEEMKAFHKKKDVKEKMPLKEQEVSNNRLNKERNADPNEFLQKKDGKENLIHKRSTSTLNSFAGQTERNPINQKNEPSFLTKQFEIKQNSKFPEANRNKPPEEDQKTLFSTFHGSTNFKELKNSPLKKTHYNIAEINSKYVQKEKNAVNFSNPENDNRSQSVEPQAKLYHFAKDFSKGREEKNIDLRNKSSIGTSFDMVKNGSSSNLTKNRDSSRLRGQKNLY